MRRRPTMRAPGGLVRAYTGAVQHALRAMETVERVTLLDARVVVAYAQVATVRRAIERAGGGIVREEFGADVAFHIHVPDDRRDELERALRDVTAGVARIEWP